MPPRIVSLERNTFHQGFFMGYKLLVSTNVTCFLSPKLFLIFIRKYLLLNLVFLIQMERLATFPQKTHLKYI